MTDESKPRIIVSNGVLDQSSEYTALIILCDDLCESIAERAADIKDSIEGSSDEQKQRMIGAMWAYGQFFEYIKNRRAEYYRQRLVAQNPEKFKK
jgi:hypothetical protein